MSSKGDQFRIRIEPERLAELRVMAERARVPLSDAFREGAYDYLSARLADDAGRVDIAGDLRALAARVDRDLRRS